MDAENARRITTAIDNTALVAGAAIAGVAALCQELRSEVGLSEEAISRIEQAILADLTGGAGRISKVPQVSKLVQQRFAQGRAQRSD